MFREGVMQLDGDLM